MNLRDGPIFRTDLQIRTMFRLGWVGVFFLALPCPPATCPPCPYYYPKYIYSLCFSWEEENYTGMKSCQLDRRTHTLNGGQIQIRIWIFILLLLSSNRVLYWFTAIGSGTVFYSNKFDTRIVVFKPDSLHYI